MLAGVLAMLFISSISQLILNVFRVSQITQQKGEIAENAQYIMGLLKRELNLTGFYGNYSFVPANMDRPDICAVPSTLTMQLALSYPVDGINNMPQGQHLCGRDVVLQQSDVLLVRQGLLGTQAKPEQVSDWKQTVYFVSEDGSFKRRRYLNGDSKRLEPLAEGVDDFQVEYGIRHIDQQGMRTEFVDWPSDEQQWSQLVAIRFYLLLSSTSTSSSAHAVKTYYYANKSNKIHDNKLRDLFTGVSRLNNLAPKIMVFDIGF